MLTRVRFLQPPPAYHTLYPRNPAPPGAAHPNPLVVPGLPKKGSESLISRYRLQDRVKQDEEIREEELGGKAVWEDSAEKREASLKERKAKMILAARQYVSSSPAASLLASCFSLRSLVMWWPVGFFWCFVLYRYIHPLTQFP